MKVQRVMLKMVRMNKNYPMEVYKRVEKVIKDELEKIEIEYKVTEEKECKDTGIIIQTEAPIHIVKSPENNEKGWKKLFTYIALEKGREAALEPLSHAVKINQVFYPRPDERIELDVYKFVELEQLLKYIKALTHMANLWNERLKEEHKEILK